MFDSEKILHYTLLNDGFSINVKGNKPTTGYMVSLKVKELTMYMSVDYEDAKQQLTDYVINNMEHLKIPDNYLGTWVNNRILYIDISINIQDKHLALTIGRQNEQKAIWDITNSKEIKL